MLQDASREGISAIARCLGARKSSSLIHRQKPASGSNYDRACVRAYAEQDGTCASRAGASTCSAKMGSTKKVRAEARRRLSERFRECIFGLSLDEIVNEFHSPC